MNTLLLPSHDTPVVTFAIANQRGSAIDPMGLEGLTYHCSELSLRGSGSMGRKEFDEEVDSLGGSLHVQLRRDYLMMRGTCLQRHWRELLALANQVFTSATMSESEFDALRKESHFDLDEIRDDDSSLAQRFFLQHCHPGLVYGRTALGTETSIDKLELEELRRLRPRLFRRSELLFAATGPLDEAEVEEAAQSLGVGDQAEPLPQVDLSPPERGAGRKLVFVDKPERKQCQVLIGHLLPAYGSSAFDTLRVAETAYGGMFTSRLMQEIRAKNGWSYGAHASMIRAKGPHLLQMGLAPAVEVCPAAVARTLEMFDELVGEGLSDEEFEFARSYLTGSAAFGRATARQRLFRRVQESVFGLPQGYEDGFADRIASLSNGEVHQALKEHFKPEMLTTVVVGSRDTVLADLEALGFDQVEVHAYDSL